MSSRTLALVNRPEDAGTPSESTDVVVLDTSWTPGPDAHPGLRPVRPAIEAIVGRINLFDESLERLDAWAASTGVADLFAAGGVTWWFHARGFIRLAVHEHLLWRHLLDDLAPSGSYERIVVPRDRPGLAIAARATAAAPDRPEIVIAGGASSPVRMARDLHRTLEPRARRVYRGVRRRVDPRLVRRLSLLDERAAAVAAVPGGVLAIVRGPSYHVIGSGGDARRGDPYVRPVLDRLAAEGHRIVTIVIGLDWRDDADWDLIADDPALIPMPIVSRRWPPPGDLSAERAALEARLATIGRVPLDLNGADLGPAMRSLVTGLGGWLTRQQQAMTSAEGLMGELRPDVLVTAWEAARTSWLGAAHRLQVPSIAIQHGVIYPNTPDYCRPPHPALVRPDITCVFGSYERDLLVELGGYDPGTVLVTGSPRATPESALAVDTPDERLQLRRELGVADEARLLVVSTARHAVGDEIHSMAMAGRLFAGPLPGVHVVFKLHPEERDGSHYVDLLTGLAEAGGFPVPPMTVVRDVDVYRLLRTADAHLGQYSTVLTDAVLTATPNMVAVGQAWADVIGYVAAGVAVPVGSVDDVRAFMADPQPPTPDDREQFLEAHYRGGDAVGRIAGTVIGVMRR